MSESRLTRRQLLRVSAIATGAAVATACGGAPPAATTAPAEPAATTAPAAEAPPSKYGEAPMLADMVAAGELPPVEERLPLEPLVTPVVEEIGQYGGIWDMAVTGQADLNGALGYLIEPWILYNDAGDAWAPNLAKAVEINPEGSEFTFHMREGMKWSDGEPFTADDVMFWYEDLVLDDELSPSKPGWLKSEGELAVVSKVDDYTFKVTFAQPAGLFLPYIAYVWGTRDMWAPKHYLTQFHPKYADADELAAKVADAGFETWVQLMGDRRQERMNADVPVIYAWKLKELGPPWVFERNPYFYKVDPEGNQLPYIDTVRASAVENASMISMKALAGELGYQARNIAFTDMPLYMDNREKGDYRVIKKMGENVGYTVFPNQNFVGDDGMLEVIKDINFRKALNLAIDRDEINDLIYLGERTSIPEIFPLLEGETELFDHIRLDVDAANALLDEAGYEMGPDGVRLRPDGEPLILKVDVFSGPANMDPAELVSNYWADIGVQTSPEEISYDLWWPRIYSHEYAFCGYVKDGLQKLACYVYLRSYAAVDHSTYWAPAWGNWYMTGGSEGIEPDVEDVRQGQLLFDKAKVTVDTDELLNILAEIQRLDLKNVWEVLTVGAGPGITIVKNNFRNVPDYQISLLSDSDMWAEQYFIKQA